MFQHSTHGLPYFRGGSFRGTRGGGGHNISYAGGFRGPSSASTRGINRWEAFSGQGQTKAEAQTSPNPNPPESAFAPELRSPSEPDTNVAKPEGLPQI